MVTAINNAPAQIKTSSIDYRFMVSYFSSMALKCENCGKGVVHGNFVSHAKNRVKRSFKPNLQRATIIVDGVKKRMLLCTDCLRLLKRKFQKPITKK